MRSGGKKEQRLTTDFTDEQDYGNRARAYWQCELIEVVSGKFLGY
jgi:hypothetical protein